MILYVGLLWQTDEVDNLLLLEGPMDTFSTWHLYLLTCAGLG